jgi:hypothetical protein
MGGRQNGRQPNLAVERARTLVKVKNGMTVATYN